MTAPRMPLERTSRFVPRPMMNTGQSICLSVTSARISSCFVSGSAITSAGPPNLKEVWRDIGSESRTSVIYSDSACFIAFESTLHLTSSHFKFTAWLCFVQPSFLVRLKIFHNGFGAARVHTGYRKQLIKARRADVADRIEMRKQRTHPCGADIRYL